MDTTPDPLADAVLEPFEEEHAERKRREAEEAERRALRVIPRIEEQGRKRTRVLVRSEPNDSDGHSVTVRFTPTEWETVRRTVLAEHGLQPRGDQ
ncbi:hypothetical protein QDA01_gp48 [Microbacterium phage Cinna]|uniref:Uncharacterized protein n=2 Tax=Mementomorivirus TaxID=2733194 RepID=A0A2Z4Q5I7_9CAUD|nr:hypothetical protein HOT41_gp51 [Microbacterium phage MementoMori]YP_010751064.1 hypothetical protein QDA01_gp48 [Microbacterium phage Cinna]AWY05312.1 hypothetical protein SEA_MEMENTOMORI_58 [Microbacterium phage MementoMori]QDH91641.1 hypothetical protein PBI_CINNA_57 [Microbacterium phage Cinna]